MIVGRTKSKIVNKSVQTNLKTRVMIDKLQTKGKMFPYELNNHNGPVKMVAMNKDSTMFASCCPQDKKVFLYDAFNYTVLNVFFTKHAVSALKFTDDSEYLIGFCSMDGVYFLKVDDFTNLTGLSEMPKSSKHRLVLFDSFKIKSGDLSYGSNQLLLIREELFKENEDYKVNHLEVYNLKDFLNSPKDSKFYKYRTFSKELKPDEAAHKAIFALDANWIFYATLTELVKFNIKTSEIEVRISFKELQLTKINSITKSLKYEVLAVCGNQGGYILDPVTLTEMKRFPTEFPMNTIAISPRLSFKKNRKLHLVMGGGVTARDTAHSKQGGTEILLYNIINEENLSKMLGHYGPVNYLDWYKDGKGFISAGEEGIVRIYRFDQSYFTDPKLN